MFLVPDGVIDLDKDETSRLGDCFLAPVMFEASFRPMPLFNTASGKDDGKCFSPWLHSVPRAMGSEYYNVISCLHMGRRS